MSLERQLKVLQVINKDIVFSLFAEKSFCWQKRGRIFYEPFSLTKHQ